MSEILAIAVIVCICAIITMVVFIGWELLKFWVFEVLFGYNSLKEEYKAKKRMIKNRGKKLKYDIKINKLKNKLI